MILTGLMTLILAILFWYDCINFILYVFSVHQLTLPRLVALLDRAFFPDSPTTAYFLSPEERGQAVQRIKSNQAGVENKHWKKEQ